MDPFGSAPSTQSMEPAESGVYTWDILDNRVFGDRAVAELFGLDAGMAESGLPLQAYLDRIHREDRPRIARAIRDALTTSVTYQESYRLSRPDGSIVKVVAFGRCFRHEGEPRFWSGIIYPLPTASGSADALLGHLLAAYDLAESAGEPLAAQKIMEAIGHVDGEHGRETGSTGLRVRISTRDKPRNS
jgi:PAS domain-containing protein